jgi:hypothetical protein
MLKFFRRRFALARHGKLPGEAPNAGFTGQGN